MAESERSRIFRDGLLEGQVCAVSGAGSGLGRETALELARLGSILVASGRRGEPLGDTAERGAGGGALGGGGGGGGGAPGILRARVPRYPRGGAGRPLLRHLAGAPRPPRRPRQQCRRPVPQPGGG